MLKSKILASLQGVLDEWLFNFNSKDDFKVSVFSNEKVNLKNAIINADRVNQELQESKSPLRLKAGMLGKLSVKVSIIPL
jgi:hypothetical protein